MNDQAVKKQPPTVRFGRWDCTLQESTYINGRKALLLLEAGTQDLVACATVNLPEQTLGPDEVFIKNWGENEGMLRALQDAGIVRATGETVRSGYVQVPKCEVLIPSPRQMHRHPGVKILSDDRQRELFGL
jgi:hypothetical protein